MKKWIWILIIITLCLTLVMEACGSFQDTSKLEQFDYSWNLMRKQMDASRPDLNAEVKIKSKKSKTKTGLQNTGNNVVNNGFKPSVMQRNALFASLIGLKRMIRFK